MIPYSYNMVDMGGIDLAEANGTVVEGLYNKIVDAANSCGDVVLYNWKFAGIEIAPQHTSILLGDTITINGAIQVTEQDVVTVPGINRVLVPLSVDSNGEYSPLNYDADGFSLVGVQVPPPALEQKAITENGTYLPSEGYYGFSSVKVDVEYDPPTLVGISVDSNGTYLPSQYDADGFNSVEVDVSSAGSYVTFHSGRLEINTGEITPSNEYCYSDLIPIADSSDIWFIDLTRNDLSSYYIGVSAYAEDGITQVGYIRQYQQYRLYTVNISSSAKFIRVANKVSNMSFAKLIALYNNIAVMSSNTTILINKEE